MAIQGSKVKLYIEQTGTGVVLAGQKNATLNRSAESIEATSKSSVGGWKEFVTGYKEWSIDADGVFVVDDAAYALLETAFLNGDEITCYLEFPSGSKQRGQAIITDFPLEFPYDDVATYSVSLQGTGALTEVAPLP